MEVHLRLPLEIVERLERGAKKARIAPGMGGRRRDWAMRNLASLPACVKDLVEDIWLVCTDTVTKPKGTLLRTDYGEGLDDGRRQFSHEIIARLRSRGVYVKKKKAHGG